MENFKTDSFVDPGEAENFKWIQSKYAPRFITKPNNIEILQKPDEFYRTLKDNFSRCSKRILISSLYLGTGDLEKDLVASIEKNMEKNTNLRAKVLLDYSRGLRGSNNSKTMLQSLITRFKERFDLSLYHTPNLRGLIKKIMPERSNETVGVLHMKIYIADNDLIISGANLSNDYFTNRQDRYIVIRNCEPLCDFLEEIIDSMGKFSFRADENGDVSYMNPNQLEHPFLGDYKQFSSGLANEINKVLNSYINKAETTENEIEKNENDAYIYPLLQIDYCGLKIDEKFTNEIFNISPNNSNIYLAVGYFNLTSDYIESIVRKSESYYKILVSSPQANGFYGSAGFSNNIPGIYSHLEEEFFKYFTSLGQDKRISIHEYKRDNWTFHGKGLWYYPNNLKENNLPSLTVVGSSNFGYRSVYRDAELQLVIHSKDQNFQKHLDLEKKNLFENSMVVTAELFSHQTRVVPTWLKIFSRSFRSFF